MSLTEKLDEKCEVLSIWQFVFMIAASASVGVVVGIAFILSVLGAKLHGF